MPVSGEANSRTDSVQQSHSSNNIRDGSIRGSGIYRHVSHMNQTGTKSALMNYETAGPMHFSQSSLPNDPTVIS